MRITILDSILTSMSPDLAPLAPSSFTLTPPLPPARHPAAVYLARLSPGSRRTMRAALETIAGLAGLTAEKFSWAALRYPHTQAIRALLLERFGPATVNRHLAALRGVLREAWRLGLMDGESHHRAIDLPSVRHTSLLRGRALTRRELQKLFRACAADRGATGARDAALIGILYGGGLRRAEVVHLDLADYTAETAELRVRHGKGQRDRICYLPAASARALDGWLTVRGGDAGPLFWPRDGRGRAPVNRRMTAQAVLLILQRRARQAHVGSFTPHDLRRTFVSDLLDAGADMAVVQRLAGHASVSTTARYDRRGAEAQRRAADLLHVPYTPVS
jgi:site-specific recombinase XerD